MSFSIALPKAGTSSRGRKPLFVPAPTTTISVSVNGTTPQTFPCTSSGCSGSFLAPAGGQVGFLFSALDAQGNVLASSSFTQAIAANGTNVIAVTLLGVVANATLSVTPAGLSSAASGQATVSAIAYDADGDVITGTYFAPLTLATNDTTGTVTVPVATLANDTATGTIAYTYGAAALYLDNHVLVSQTSSTETSAQHAVPFVVGRTFYTFTSSSIIGFAPGSTTPTRTVGISPAFEGVNSITCDGTNVYVMDTTGNVLYGLAPGATSPSSPYFISDDVNNWVAANPSPTTGNRAQFYVSDFDYFPTPAVIGFQGAISAPPFALPPNTVTLDSSNNSAAALQVDPSGNVYAAIDINQGTFAGYDVFGPALGAPAHSGMNANTGYGPYQIAVDTSVSPPRIYTGEVNNSPGLYTGEISEYDNLAATPTSISTDSLASAIPNSNVVNNIGNLYTDPAGRVYTAAAGGVFHVYNPGGLSGGVGNVAYSLPGLSLAFDSASYAYSANASGTITVYAPGSTLVVATLSGAGYGQPATPPDELGTFCR